MNNREQTFEEAVQIFLENKHDNPRKYVDKKFLSDKNFALEVVKKDVFLISELPKFRNDKDVMMEVVSGYGICLRYASIELRKDKELVLKAVQNNGAAINYAVGKELKEDRELIFNAMLHSVQYGYNPRKIFHKYRNKPDIILEVIKANNRLIYYIDPKNLSDQSFVRELTKIIPPEKLVEVMEYKKENESQKKLVETKDKVVDFVKDKYYEMDEIMFDSPSGIFEDNAVFLALTPLPYVHLVNKGIVSIVQHTKDLSEYIKEQIELKKDSKSSHM